MRTRHRQQLQRKNVWRIKELEIEAIHSNETQGVTCSRIECPLSIAYWILPGPTVVDIIADIVTLFPEHNMQISK